MTTIVGYHTEDKCYMVGDTLITAGDTVIGHSEKVFSANGWAIGLCGYARGLNVIEDHLEDITHGADNVSAVVERIIYLLENDGWTHPADDEGGPQGYPVDLIIGHSTGLWTVNGCTGNIVSHKNDYTAIGSGRAYALGALNFAYEVRSFIDVVSVEERIVCALDAATQHDLHTAGLGKLHTLLSPAPKKRASKKNP